MENRNKMGYMPMPKLIANMSLPLMFSLLIQSLYNIVDSIFVARLGQDALTAVSLAYPVQILMIAVAVGTSVGINSLLSKSIGAKDFELTGNAATTGVLLALTGMTVFMFLGLFCTDRFVGMFTDDPIIGGACGEYLFICMLFCLGTFVGTMFQCFLQSVGNTFGSMLTLVAGAVTNLILDPILIFGLLGFPAMGVRGAAVATVIGQWITALYAVLLNRFRNPIVQPRWKGYKLEGRIVADIYRVGLPTIVTQALGSLMVSAINGILMPISPVAVAFFGVYYKLQNFLFMPMNGLGQATIPIVGYNYGAGQPKRIRAAFLTAVPMAAGIALLGTVIFCAIPEPLLGLFDADAAMLALGVPALRTISFTFAFAAVTTILGYAASGLGNGLINMAGTGLRQVLIIFAFMNPIMNALMYVVVLLILTAGSMEVHAGTATPGTIIAAITYTTQLLNGILMLVMLFQNISRGIVSWGRVREILYSQPDLKDGGFCGDTKTRGQVEFRNVSFTYPGSSQVVLKDINLTIHSGETVAVMGTTGCGKSSLVNLVPRFYDAVEGTVLVDGVNVREYNQKALRQKISMVLQKSELFSVPIRKNIAWGCPGASEEAIARAAGAAQADSFIQSSPDGYDTMVAERGMSLSGGQKQRISIARAIVKDAEILIFDDSTSALDLKTEADLYAALNEVSPDSTKIIIAQRIASVRRADRIVVLENGGIAASGTHEELMRTCPAYQDIYDSQMEEEEAYG